MATYQADFVFKDVGRLQDRELVLLLANKYPGNPEIKHVPSYEFKMALQGSEEKIGYIDLRVISRF